MSNFTRLVPSLLLKGLCSNFNADIYSPRRNISVCVYYIILCLQPGCVSYLRAGNILSIHHRIHTLLLHALPARPGPGTRAVVYSLSAPAALCGNRRRWKLEHAVRLWICIWKRSGVAPSCAGSRQKKCICIIFISILDLFILGIYSSFDCRLLPLVRLVFWILSFQARKSIVHRPLCIQKRKLYNSTGFKFN